MLLTETFTGAAHKMAKKDKQVVVLQRDTFYNICSMFCWTAVTAGHVL